MKYDVVLLRRYDANHATVRSKSLVNLLPGYAHGTSATDTPCSGQMIQCVWYSTSTRIPPQSRPIQIAGRWNVYHKQGMIYGRMGSRPRTIFNIHPPNQQN